MLRSIREFLKPTEIGYCENQASIESAALKTASSKSTDQPRVPEAIAATTSGSRQSNTPIQKMSREQLLVLIEEQQNLLEEKDDRIK